MKNITRFLFFLVAFVGITGGAIAETSVVGETTTANGDVLTVTSQGYVDTLFAETHKAENITSGQLATEHLYVGREADTVAAGDDGRFDTMVIGQPEKEAEEGRVLVWVEP